jgi:hypothetical protein
MVVMKSSVFWSVILYGLLTNLEDRVTKQEYSKKLVLHPRNLLLKCIDVYRYL